MIEVEIIECSLIGNENLVYLDEVNEKKCRCTCRIQEEYHGEKIGKSLMKRVLKYIEERGLNVEP